MSGYATIHRMQASTRLVALALLAIGLSGCTAANEIPALDEPLTAADELPSYAVEIFDDEVLTSRLLAEDGEAQYFVVVTTHTSANTCLLRAVRAASTASCGRQLPIPLTLADGLSLMLVSEGVDPGLGWKPLGGNVWIDEVSPQATN